MNNITYVHTHLQFEYIVVKIYVHWILDNNMNAVNMKFLFK